MTKKILFILLFISTYSYGQYTVIPDINFEKALISLGYDDKTPDGKILTSKINKITYLDISYKLIDNLTGIEDFTLLRHLYCNSNKLANLNISKNSFITNLNCSNNKINSLDITQNINLQVIDFSFNQISNINTASNSALNSMSCNNNTINTLDVSKNIELRSLNCSQNKLTILDLSSNIYIHTIKCNKNILYGLNLKNRKTGILSMDSDFKENPNLSCIQVDDAIYSSSNWFRLKESSASYFEGNCMEYTLIPDLNFEAKLISLKIDKDGLNGKIFTFDAKQTKTLSIENNNSSNKIKNLTGIEDFTSLESLGCSGNLLETLDLSNNTKLLKLDCATNKLTNLNVSQNINLKELDCYDNKLVNLNFSKNTNLQYLYCHKNQLINLDVDKNTNLNYLWCNFNQLTSLNISNNINLKSLYCGFNQLSALDVSTNIALSDLSLSGNKISNIDVSKNIKLKTLSLEENQITDLNIFNNLLLSGLHCYGNQIKKIDVSKNIELTDFRCNSNNLISLNLKNGKNTNLNDSYLDFTKNPNLTCIQVDNEIYSKTNWNEKKDTTASFSTTCSLGIEGSSFNNVNIYPNPTKGELHIENINLKKASLYNSIGQLIKTDLFEVDSNINTIDLSGLSEGLYYIYLQIEGSIAVRKVILK
ncbi:leucine-rich repeat domain-containing protein [Flavobacterium sp. FlaQc-57]|uniref:leucine-rich repeat domain-containing protein n=1 Tax=Flavobacterium sp. FlaQc-57 TaxID=3374186 RepID=UPI00375729F0